jgi:hypothetical protein
MNDQAEKKIAMLVMNDQAEALRVAGGITILNENVDIFLLDRQLDISGAASAPFEMIRELGLKIFTNIKEMDKPDGFEYLPTDVLARRLLEYDHALAF